MSLHQSSNGDERNIEFANCIQTKRFRTFLPWVREQWTTEHVEMCDYVPRYAYVQVGQRRCCTGNAGGKLVYFCLIRCGFFYSRARCDIVKANERNVKTLLPRSSPISFSSKQKGYSDERNRAQVWPCSGGRHAVALTQALRFYLWFGRHMWAILFHGVHNFVVFVIASVCLFICHFLV